MRNAFSDMAPPIALDNAGRVIHARTLNDATIEVTRFDGAGFTLLGTPTDNPAPRTAGHASLALALNSQDEPLIAYRREVAGVRQLVVRRFAGGLWQDVGPAFTDVTSGPIRLTIDATDRPVLALLRNAGFFTEVHRFDPVTDTWRALGAPAQALGAQFDNRIELATMPNGDVVAAVDDSLQLRVARHDGTGWAALAGGALASSPTLAQQFTAKIVGGSDGPWMFITQGGHPQPLRLLRHIGTGWETIEVPRPAGAGILQAPEALVLANGRPVAAFSDFTLGVFVTRFIDGRLEAPFATGRRAGQSALTARGSNVAIAYQDFVGNYEVNRLLFP